MISKSQLKNCLAIFLIALFITQGCVGIASTTPSGSPNTEQLDLSQMNVQEWASTSPDGKWLATGLVAFPKENIGGQRAYVRLMIFRVDGKIRWTIIDEWQDINQGFPIPAPLKWSRDGQHFYFTHRVTPDGCSALPFLGDLQQVDLDTGRVENLLDDSALTLALSPDDSQVAYFGREFVVRDLATGEERGTRLEPGKEFNAGNIVWSPDGSVLVLTLAIHPCTGPYGVSKTVWAESTSLVWVDANTLQQRVLIEEDPRLFIPVEWDKPEQIVITDGEENSLWYLDVKTGESSRP